MVPVMKTDPSRAGRRDLLPLFPEHSSVTPDGELVIGGVGVRDLAGLFGTPAYIVDEAGLRDQARRMRDGLATRHPDSEVVFASKSFPCLAAYKLFAAEGLSIDVAGAGELVMALAAGVPPERMYLHGNAKTTAELIMAQQAGVGRAEADNFDDIDRLEQLATRPQPVLIRIIRGSRRKPTSRSPPAARTPSSGCPWTRPARRSPASEPARSCAWTGCTCTSGRRSWTPSRSPGPSRRSPCSAPSRSMTRRRPRRPVHPGGRGPVRRAVPGHHHRSRPRLSARRRQARDRARPVAGGRSVRHALPGEHGQAHWSHVRRGGRRHGRQPRRCSPARSSRRRSLPAC